MQRIWLVISFPMFIWMASCSSKVGDDGFSMIQEGCSQVSPSDEAILGEIATSYFIDNVGVPVDDLKIGKISSCEDGYIVPVSAATVQVPTSRVWYVDLDRERVPYRILRPM